MSVKLRIFLAVTMVTALFFGFLHLFVPGGSLYNFERLHIFLFNLVSGGTILMFYSENQKKLSRTTIAFIVFSFVYAILAFQHLYLPAMLVAFVLAALVDSVRIRLFSIFPWGFFDPKTPVYKKFHQASLLCLSSGLVISGLVILNNEYLHLVSFEKLTLDTFFLGFSFPLSLITMSIIFSFVEGNLTRKVEILKNFGFWSVNLGVIIFFCFILFGNLPAQLVVTSILFFSVVMIYFLYRNLGVNIQQKSFLTSGMFFLWYTAITGILYIALEFRTDYSSENMKYLLRMHSYASLYGWNLSGLAVICRKNDFPIRMNSATVIAIHWVTAILLAPLGTYYQSFAVPAFVCYIFIIYTMMFSKGIAGPGKKAG